MPSRRILVVAVGTAVVLASGVSLASAEPSLVSSVGDSNLGSVEVGKSSTPLTITLSSTATTTSETPDLTNPGRIEGADVGDFTLTPGTCTNGYALSTTSTCTNTVTFTPKSVGTKTVTFSAGGFYLGQMQFSRGLQRSLTGPACAPAAGAYACEISFTITGTATATPTPTVGAALTPATRVITAGRTAKVTLTASNTGQAALSNVTTKLPIPSGFRVTNRGGGTLSGGTLSFTAPSIAVGASSTYTVTLRPVGLKARKATLTTTVSATGATSATATGTITVRAAKVKKKKPVPVVG